MIFFACKYPLATKIMTNYITVDYLPEAIPAMQTVIASAFEAGAKRVVLDLDHIDHLDAEGVRGLITLLRRSREIGGEVALRVSRPEIVRSLSVMALDRLFPMVGAA